MSGNLRENRESKKDDIVWQIQYDIPIINNIIAWTLRIGQVALFGYFLYLGLTQYIQRYDTLEWYKQAVIIGIGIAFIALIWNLLSIILQTLNLKAIYATNDYLIIQKHFGKDMILSLGSFYIVFTNVLYSYETDYVTIQAFDNSAFFVFGVAKNHKNFRGYGIKNIEELETILKPKIEKYLITLEEKYFQEFIAFDYQYIHGGLGYTMSLDMENILRLREGNNDDK